MPTGDMNAERDAEGGSGASGREAGGGVNGGASAGLTTAAGQYYHSMVAANPYASVSPLHRVHSAGKRKCFV